MASEQGPESRLHTQQTKGDQISKAAMACLSTYGEVSKSIYPFFMRQFLCLWNISFWATLWFHLPPACLSLLAAGGCGALGAGSLHAAWLLGAGRRAGMQPITAPAPGRLGLCLLHGWPARPPAMMSGQIPDSLVTSGSLLGMGPLAEIPSSALTAEELEYADIHAVITLLHFLEVKLGNRPLLDNAPPKNQ